MARRTHSYPWKRAAMPSRNIPGAELRDNSRHGARHPSRVGEHRRGCDYSGGITSETSIRLAGSARRRQVKRCYTFEEDKLLLSITPHMHYRAKDALYELMRPNGTKETLLSVPTYHFDWQLVYRFQDPIVDREGQPLDGHRALRQQPEQSRESRSDEASAGAIRAKKR